MIDAAGNADQANAAIQNFAQRGAAAIVDMVFPYSSIGAGLDAAKRAKIPVVTWGGGWAAASPRPMAQAARWSCRSTIS